MTKQLTVAQDPEANKLIVAQVDDFCGKRSVSTGSEEERRTPLTLVQSLSVHFDRKNSLREVVVRKRKKVTRRWG